MKDTIALIIFYIVSVAEVIIYIPQIYKLIKTKHSEDISQISQTIGLTMSGLWLAYWILTDITLGQLIVQVIIVIEVLLQFILVKLYAKKRNVVI